MITPLNINELLLRVSAGEHFEFRHFYGHTAREDGRLSDAIFSQFYPCSFEIENRTYRWSEQWMMAGKARLFGDGNVLEKILIADTPHDCKKLGRSISNFNEAIWSNARFDLVTLGNIAKFGQNDVLKNYLLKTGKEILTEVAPHDKIWGIGMGREEPHINRPEMWRGLNLLGFALIRTRGVLCGQLDAPSPFNPNSVHK